MAVAALAEPLIGERCNPGMGPYLLMPAAAAI
jgi:hypothetical protein